LLAIEPLLSRRIRNTERVCYFCASGHVNVYYFRIDVVESIVNAQVKCNWAEELFSVDVSLYYISLSRVELVELIKVS
jgi:hypothetical protein